MSNQKDLKSEVQSTQKMFVVIGVLMLLYPVQWKYREPVGAEPVVWLVLAMTWVVIIWTHKFWHAKKI